MAEETFLLCLILFFFFENCLNVSSITSLIHIFTNSLQPWLINLCQEILTKAAKNKSKGFRKKIAFLFLDAVLEKFRHQYYKPV